MFDYSSFMPEQASSWSADVDWLNAFITNVSIFCILGITGVMLYFGVKYRRRSENQETAYITHSASLETVWTLIPTLVCMFVFYKGYVTYHEMRNPPAHSIEVAVQGFQWGWNFQYSTGKKSASELVVPVGQPVRLVMKSQDVNHSFFIPVMRVKEDLVASMYTYLWFTPTKVGEFPIFCAEYCGLTHYNMRATLRVVSNEEYQDFINDRRAQELTPQDKGLAKMKELACISCHSLDGSPLVGPTFKGVWGKSEELVDGSKVNVDENYVRESILNPNAKIVKGFAPAMPAFEGRANDEDIGNIIAYLKTVQ